MHEKFAQFFNLRGRYTESIDQIMRLSDKELAKKTERVNRSFVNIPIIPGRGNEKGEKYPYSRFELTADVPFQASLFEDAADLIIHSNPELFKNVDIILSEGDRGGGPLAQAIGRKTGPKISLANWHKSIPEGLSDTIIVETKIGFSGEGSIVVSGIRPGQRIVLVDELLSTGGTAEAMIKAVEKAGGIIVGAFFIGEKVDQKGRVRLTKQFPNLNITTLVRFNARIENGFTTDAEEDRLIELISTRNPFDSIDTIHEIANFENLIYDYIFKKYKKTRKEIEEEMEKIIESIKMDYLRGQNLRIGNIFEKKARKTVSKYLKEQ